MLTTIFRLFLTCFVLVLAGCEPTNMYDCQMQAAKMATSEGVSLANYACNKKFPAKSN